MVEYLFSDSHHPTIQEPKVKDLLHLNQYFEECPVSGLEIYPVFNNIGIFILGLGLIALGVSYCAVLANLDLKTDSIEDQDCFLLYDIV